MTDATPFAYPSKPHRRKHGPVYRDFADYKDWLRDDFDFRCVYCLRREVWERRRAIWVVEHLISRHDRPDLATEYTNVVLACTTCNSWKSASSMPDPCKMGYGSLVTVRSDGSIIAKKKEGKLLIKIARLDDADSTEWRRKIIHLLCNYSLHEPEEYKRWMGFPVDLPDLTNRKPRSNSKPQSKDDCRFAQRQRGELPETY
ncbi:MAG: HNH endonuclease [Planctomycetota bacterium]